MLSYNDYICNEICRLRWACRRLRLREVCFMPDSMALWTWIEFWACRWPIRSLNNSAPPWCAWTNVTESLQMWPKLINLAKEGGLEVVQTYVFWDGHERQRGKVLVFSWQHLLSSTLTSDPNGHHWSTVSRHMRYRSDTNVSPRFKHCTVLNE